MIHCSELFLIPNLYLFSTKIDYEDDYMCQGDLLDHKEFRRFVYKSLSIKALDEILRLK